MESAGIPDLADYGRVHVSPANVSSGSHATNTNTEKPMPFAFAVAV